MDNLKERISRLLYRLHEDGFKHNGRFATDSVDETLDAILAEVRKEVPEEKVDLYVREDTFGRSVGAKAWNALRTELLRRLGE